MGRRAGRRRAQRSTKRATPRSLKAYTPRRRSGQGLRKLQRTLHLLCRLTIRCHAGLVVYCSGGDLRQRSEHEAQHVVVQHFSTKGLCRRTATSQGRVRLYGLRQRRTRRRARGARGEMLTVRQGCDGLARQRQGCHLGPRVAILDGRQTRRRRQYSAGPQAHFCLWRPHARGRQLARHKLPGRATPASMSDARSTCCTTDGLQGPVRRSSRDTRATSR